jgi:hypothetical protein
VHEFDSHVAVQGGLVRFVDLGHATASKVLNYLVLAYCSADVPV